MFSELALTPLDV